MLPPDAEKPPFTPGADIVAAPPAAPAPPACEPARARVVFELDGVSCPTPLRALAFECARFCFHYAERLIGSIRRECVDNVVVFGERHLRHLLESYQRYYNGVRTHLSLNKDAPVSRAVQAVGSIVAKPLLGGLHHHYGRI